MKPLSAEQQLSAIITMAATIMADRTSHERRNERLEVVRRMIEDFIDYSDRTLCYLGETPAAHSDVLRTCYQLAIWQQKNETHTCVRNRLRLLVEVALYGKSLIFHNRDLLAAERRTAALVRQSNGTEPDNEDPPGAMDDYDTVEPTYSGDGFTEEYSDDFYPTEDSPDYLTNVNDQE